MSHHRGQDQHDVTSPWLPSRAARLGWRGRGSGWRWGGYPGPFGK